VQVNYSSPQADFARIKAMNEAGAMEFDLLELGGQGDVTFLSKQGFLQKLDLKALGIDGLPKEYVSDYGVTYGPSGSTLIWNTTIWPEDGKHPTTVLDLFNVEDFPGKRCILGAAPYTNGILEYALMADGVPPDQVYPIDMERALKKLDTIRDDLVFWNSGAESVQFVLDGQCDLGTTWSGRPALRKRQDPDAPIAMTWKDAMVGGGWFAIPAGAKNAKAAEALIKLAMQPESQAKLCNIIAYCLPIPGVKELIDAEMRPWVPIDDNIAQTALAENGDYYAEHLPELTERWNAWRLGQ
jgi:putative spermidine/putrescine transport system substrate-binding protein